MKTKEKKQLQQKKITELQTLLKEKKETLLSLQLEHVQRKLKNVRGIRDIKREIAHIMTELRRKELLVQDMSAEQE